VKNDPNLHHHLKLVGTELGKMFEHGFLHGDLTSYHILVNGKVHIFDLETTRKYNGDEFFNRLAIEWEGFINSTQGRRWKIPFNKEQEEIVFESVRENITTRPTIKVLEKVVMKNNNSF
jgi:serine/threonine-protein kinase RIO1